MVNCRFITLDKVLIDLAYNYDVELSFDSKLLSDHHVTLNRQFEDVEELLDELLDELPLSWERVDDIYVIFPKESKASNFIVGQIVDRQTGEALPFADIFIGGKHSMSDDKGSYLFEVLACDTCRVEALYLGYLKLDTLQNIVADPLIKLTPTPLPMDEIVIDSHLVERATQVGEEAGLITVNQQIASYLPGNGDNAIFNLLRIQPGVLASGEQLNKLILWGSPEGTSRIYFDGIPLWGLCNFSDNISVVNPYMVNRIDLYRGGYGVSSPDAAGGLARIRGKMGGAEVPTLGITINNETINSCLEIPIGEKSTLIAAYRQNYQNLFDVDDFTNTDGLGYADGEMVATSDYDFRDVNFKYSIRGTNNNLFYLSALYADDRLGYDLAYDMEVEKVREQIGTLPVRMVEAERKQQIGISSYYGRTWSSGVSASTVASYSRLNNTYDFLRNIYDSSGEVVHSRDMRELNNISAVALKFNTMVDIAAIHRLSFGAEFNGNDLLLREDSISINRILLRERAGRLTLYGEDKISLRDDLSLTAGLRATYNITDKSYYYDPRVSLKFRPMDHLKFNAAWGIYHQYVVEASVSDEMDNYVYCWNLAGLNGVPVIRSQHNVVGVAYAPTNYIFSIDAYRKTFDGLTRFVSGNLSNGDSRVYGLDLYAKRDFRGGSCFWISYSYADNKERFDHFSGTDYLRSLQDQRHELKAAMIYRIGKFHLSTTYIYGSGFPIYTDAMYKSYIEPDYNRLDLSAIYSFMIKGCRVDGGVSLLNVTNEENVRYNNFSHIPLNQQSGISVESASMPFSLLLYLKFAF